MTERVVIVAGDFSTLTDKDIEYLKTARSFGDKLVIGLTSKDWLAKQGKPVRTFRERATTLLEYEFVDNVIECTNGDSANNVIFFVLSTTGNNSTIVFVTNKNIKDSEEFSVYGNNRYTEFMFWPEQDTSER